MVVLILGVLVVLVVAALAVMGYRMGPAPGQAAITERDQRLQSERADQAAFRLEANPNLRTDHERAVKSLSASAVLEARASRQVDGSLNETEALANAIVHVDHLERDAIGTSVGPLIADLSDYLAEVGVLNELDPVRPEIAALSPDDLAGNPGILIRLIGVADLGAWPR
jgi:hypothetical protein